VFNMDLFYSMISLNIVEEELRSHGGNYKGRL
jgi:hypothetical protein